MTQCKDINRQLTEFNSFSSSSVAPPRLNSLVNLFFTSCDLLLNAAFLNTVNLVTHHKMSNTIILNINPRYDHNGGGRGVIVIVEGNGHGDTSSNPRRSCLHVT